jgi:hypothetical protein
MENDVRQVIALRIEPPKKVIERIGQPRNWLILAQPKGREHPLEILAPEAAPFRIAEEQGIVVEVEKLGVDRGRKADKRNDPDDGGSEEKRSCLELPVSQAQLGARRFVD